MTWKTRKRRSEDPRGWILLTLAGDGVSKDLQRVRGRSLKAAHLLTEQIAIEPCEHISVLVLFKY
jgi:hypothetical protein